MAQNRNKLIDLFIGNLANVIIHNVLQEAINDDMLAMRYGKEISNSLEIARTYRQKINPVYSALPEKDREVIKQKIINKANAELQLRISKGYKNINLSLVEQFTVKTLKELNVI